ncbi:hypothetical protein [Lentzea sp. NPDC092896]|uniref:hypothetical protein n=1 Tax=Lentzea sp. NPDC092896 TaxID=3364127 RepID=UPI00382CF824
MRPDPFNEFQARAQRERERATERAERASRPRPEAGSGGLDVGMVVTVIVGLAAFLVFVLAITPSWTW